jgi:hypothetical protein
MSRQACLQLSTFNFSAFAVADFQNFSFSFFLTGVASAEHLNGRRGHEISTSGRQNGTGFQGNGLGLWLGQQACRPSPQRRQPTPIAVGC